MRERWPLLLFYVIAAAEIVSQFFDLHALHFVSKPLLIIVLVLYYNQSVSSVNRIFVGALVFCWMGDVFLLFEPVSGLFFMAGLGSFLIAHLFFILSYRQFQFAEDGYKGTQRVRLSFPVVLAGSGLVVVLSPRLGDLKIPVMIYALALTLMVLQSIFRLGRTSAQSFWMVFAGAILFMISDSLLAINKFYQPISNAGVWVMSTYIAAVYSIVRGVIFHPAEINHKSY